MEKMTFEGIQGIGQICAYRGEEKQKSRGCPWMKEHNQCQPSWEDDGELCVQLRI